MDRDNRKPRRREQKENRGLQVDVHNSDIARALRKLPLSKCAFSNFAQQNTLKHPNA